MTVCLCLGTGRDGVCAADERYSLGTIQEDDVLSVGTGKEVVTTIGFYNVDGTAPVDVEVTIPIVPDGWSAEFLPRCEEASAASSESGRRFRLHVEPMRLTSERASCPGTCEEQYWLPGRGYVCALAIDMRVAAPMQTARLTDTLTVHVVGTWDVASGAPPQERDLQYDLAVVPGECVRDSAGTLPVVALVVAGVILGLVLRRIAKSSPL